MREAFFESDPEIFGDRRERDAGPPAGVRERRRRGLRLVTPSGVGARHGVKPSCACGYSESAIVTSKPSITKDAVRRRRECVGCGRRFTTYELHADVLDALHARIRALEATLGEQRTGTE